MFFQISKLKRLNCVLWTCTQNLNLKLHCHFKKVWVFAKVFRQGLSCSPVQGLGLAKWKNGKQINASQCESRRQGKMWTNTYMWTSVDQFRQTGPFKNSFQSAVIKRLRCWTSTSSDTHTHTHPTHFPGSTGVFQLSLANVPLCSLALLLYIHIGAGADNITGPVAVAYFKNRQRHQNASTTGLVGPAKIMPLKNPKLKQKKNKYKNLTSHDFTPSSVCFAIASVKLWRQLLLTPYVISMKDS